MSLGRVNSGKPYEGEGGRAVKQHQGYACTGEAPQGKHSPVDTGFKKGTTGRVSVPGMTRGR